MYGKDETEPGWRVFVGCVPIWYIDWKCLELLNSVESTACRNAVMQFYEIILKGSFWHSNPIN